LKQGIISPKKYHPLKASDKIIDRYNIIVLAAGASTRLGEPKQLLPYNNSNLVQHAVSQAAGTSAENVIVVVGSGANEISESIHGSKLHIVENTGWQEGIGSSIRKGIESSQLLSPSIDGVIIMVCDQPYVTSSYLQLLADHQHDSGKPIVASHYRNTVGTPVLFHHSVFPELLKLKGDSGAKSILIEHADKVFAVPFPLGDVDIDNRSDYEMLLKTNSEV
jgi:molybdenum cofactor cytidylyltransferase